MKKLSLALISLTAWLAVALQIYISLTRYNLDHSHLFRLVDTLSYFTVTTNTLVAVVATGSLFQRSGAFLTRAAKLQPSPSISSLSQSSTTSCFAPCGTQPVSNLSPTSLFTPLYPSSTCLTGSSLFLGPGFATRSLRGGSSTP
jgi:hypothetical protein